MFELRSMIGEMLSKVEELDDFTTDTALKIKHLALRARDSLRKGDLEEAFKALALIIIEVDYEQNT